MADERTANILFSVIIPVYNVAPFLEKSLNSLLDQAMEETQVLVIDDGSTDGSSEICDAYAARWPQVEVVHQPNAGVAAARNCGLRKARGEYILWMDPDDWVLPGWLENIQREIKAHQPDMLIFDYAKFHNNRQEVCQYGLPPGRLDADQVLLDLSEDHRLTSVLWNKVIHRRFFQGMFNESLRCMEDYDLLYRMVMQMEKIRYLSAVLYGYRIREEGLVRAKDLTVGYQSYQESLKRLHHLQQAGKRAGILGTMLQAKGFCCKYYQNGMPHAFAEQYAVCKNHLRRHRTEMLQSKQLGLKEKVKYMLIPWRPVGWAYAMVKRLRQREIEQ